ncbi:MAG: hypothetical protein J7502_10740 [Flavisolibacter sp.]|nr:hypothetical protein [Flavisolibacter sp.]
MNKLFITLLVITLGIQACDKKDAGTKGFDFSNTIAPYVALSSTSAKTVKQDTSIKFTFQMRTALQENVTVTYNVTGAVNLSNQTVVIERNKTSAVATVSIPANTITPPNTTAQAVLQVVKAVTASGRQLTLGQKNTPDKEKVTINITQ